MSEQPEVAVKRLFVPVEAALTYVSPKTKIKATPTPTRSDASSCIEQFQVECLDEINRRMSLQNCKQTKLELSIDDRSPLYSSSLTPTAFDSTLCACGR